MGGSSTHECWLVQIRPEEQHDTPSQQGSVTDPVTMSGSWPAFSTRWSALWVPMGYEGGPLGTFLCETIASEVRVPRFQILLPYINTTNSGPHSNVETPRPGQIS